MNQKTFSLIFILPSLVAMKSAFLYSPAQWDDIRCDPVVLIRP